MMSEWQPIQTCPRNTAVAAKLKSGLEMPYMYFDITGWDVDGLFHISEFVYWREP